MESAASATKNVAGKVAQAIVNTADAAKTIIANTMVLLGTSSCKDSGSTVTRHQPIPYRILGRSLENMEDKTRTVCHKLGARHNTWLRYSTEAYSPSATQPSKTANSATYCPNFGKDTRSCGRRSSKQRCWLGLDHSPAQRDQGGHACQAPDQVADRHIAASPRMTSTTSGDARGERLGLVA